MKSAVIVLTALSLMTGSAAYAENFDRAAADNQQIEYTLISKQNNEEKIPTVLMIDTTTYSVSLKTLSGEPIPGKEIWIVMNRKEYSLTTDSNGNAALPAIADTGTITIDGSFSGDDIYSGTNAEEATVTVPAEETVKQTGTGSVTQVTSADLNETIYSMNGAVSSDCSLPITGLTTIIVDNRIVAANNTVAEQLKFSAVPVSILGITYQVASAVSLASGSTVLTMEPFYLQSLGVGKHTITFVYETIQLCRLSSIWQKNRMKQNRNQHQSSLW